MGVDELLAAFDQREVQCGLRDDVQAADVGHKTGRVEAFAHHPEGFFHVLGVAAAGAYTASAKPITASGIWKPRNTSSPTPPS